MKHPQILLLLCSSVACGPSGDAYPYLRPEGCEVPCEPDAGVDAGRGDAGLPIIPPEPLEDWDTTLAGPLSGIFAVEVQIPARAVVPVEARQLYRMRIVQRDDDVRMKITPCRFALPDVPSVATLIIPPRLESILRGLAVEEQGPFLSAVDPIGATLSPPRVFVLLGASLDDPTMDPLPTPAAPERAIDQDEDGHPGVTVLADTILCRDSPQALYLSLRASVAMSATLESLDEFQGAVDPTIEQSVLDVSDPCLATAAMLEVEVLDGGQFRAVRVGDAEDIDVNGNVSCEEIAYFAPGFFGEFWAPE